jgi:DNA-binding MarR family transcriptional regulator
MSKEDQIQKIVEVIAKLQRPALKRAGRQQLGLSHAQAGMLYLLYYHEQSSVKEAAQFLGITKSAVTQLLDPLVAKGLVSRHSDAADRRVVRLSLTGKGKDYLKKLGKYKFAGLRSALAHLSEGELETLYQLHKKMAEKL